MKTIVIFLLVLVSLCFADRKVTTSIEHECRKEEDNSTVCGSYAKITAVSDTDVLHYIVTALGFPTVFVAYTKPDAIVSVDLSRLLSQNVTEKAGSVVIKPAESVLYTYSLLFTKLIDYNDTKDSADMSSYDATSTAWNIYDLSDFTWNNMSNVSDPTGNMVVLQASSNEPSDLWEYNGTLSIKLKAFSSSGREDQLPHLEYNANIAQFDLNIDHLYTNLSMSRFAVEVILISGGQDTQKIDGTRSIDDEYAPGVFFINNWLTKSEGDSGFLQWKPVCYQSLSRSRSKATGMKHYHLQSLTEMDDMLTNTLVYAYYGKGWASITTAQASNFSFGLGQDGGYNKTQVLTWSGSVGYGVPPQDSVSTIVLIIISAGLGIPVVIIIFGGIFVCIKKRTAKPDKPLLNVQSNGYQPISDH